MAGGESPSDRLNFPIPIYGDRLTEQFWTALAGKRLQLQFDEEEQRFQFYPRPVSIFGASHALTWRDVSGRGRIAAVTVVEPRPPAPAYHLGVIDLEEGARIMAPLTGFREGAAQVGALVTISWMPDFPFIVFGPGQP